MEKKHYKTLIKADHRFYGNTFIVGKVSGIQAVVCDDFEKSYSINESAAGTILSVDCTEEQYAAFIRAVERMYPFPDMFEFDYKV